MVHVGTIKKGEENVTDYKVWIAKVIGILEISSASMKRPDSDSCITYVKQCCDICERIIAR